MFKKMKTRLRWYPFKKTDEAMSIYRSNPEYYNEIYRKELAQNADQAQEIAKALVLDNAIVQATIVGSN
jgi:hypothetical protein